MSIFFLFLFTFLLLNKTLHACMENASLHTDKQNNNPFVNKYLRTRKSNYLGMELWKGHRSVSPREDRTRKPLPHAPNNYYPPKMGSRRALTGLKLDNPTTCFMSNDQCTFFYFFYFNEMSICVI